MCSGSSEFPVATYQIEFTKEISMKHLSLLAALALIDLRLS